MICKNQIKKFKRATKIESMFDYITQLTEILTDERKVETMFQNIRHNMKMLKGRRYYLLTTMCDKIFHIQIKITYMILVSSSNFSSKDKLLRYNIAHLVLANRFL